MLGILKQSIKNNEKFHIIKKCFTTSKPFDFSSYKLFVPEEHGLSKDFRFTNFSELRGSGCKVPQPQLLQYLELIGGGGIGNETPDCSLLPVRKSQKKLVSTIDFFNPLVHDPYIQGRIACANVLSDLYAMGITEVDTILMVLGVCTKMNEKEKAVTTSLMIKGFDDAAAEAGTSVTGGQTVLNPWPIIGGAAISVVSDNEYIMPNGAEQGDVILLTKPLGTQVVVNVQQWLTSGNLKWQKAEEFVNETEVERAYKLAMRSMSTLNLEGAKLMRKYGAKAATDITGFGILGHAGYLAKANKNKIDFRIHTLPVFEKMYLLDKEITNFKLFEGISAETSGGLFLCIAKNKAQDFIKEMHDKGQFCWEIGEVIDGDNSAFFADDLNVLDI